MVQRFCINCGERLAEDANFCMECGQPVEKSENMPEEISDLKPVDEIVKECGEPVSKCEEEIPAPAADCEAPEEPVSEAAENPEEPALPVPETDEQPGREGSLPQNPHEDPQTVVETVDAAAEVADAPETEPVIQETETLSLRVRKRRGAFRTILAVVLCISMFTVSCLAVSVFGLQFTASESNLKYLANELAGELYDILDVIPARKLVPELRDDATLVEYLIHLALEKGLQLDRFKLGKILESSGLVDHISDLMIGYLTDIRRGTQDAALDEAEVLELLREGNRAIMGVIKVGFKDSDLQQAAFYIADSGVLVITNADLLERYVPVVYYTIQYSLSIWLMIACVGVVLLHVLLLAAVNRWTARSIVRDTGITLTVAGVLSAVPAVSLPRVLDTLIPPVPVVGNMIDIVISYLSDSYLVGALIALTLGVVLIITGIVLRRVEKDKVVYTR